MAADMLLDAQRVDKPDVGLPADSQLNTFRDGTNTVCQDAGPVKVPEIASSLYVMSSDLKPR